MSSEELELDFQFDNEELANFLENFAGKIREGDVGLSFKGRDKVEISPTEDNNLEMEFYEDEEKRSMELEINLREEKETKESSGRNKIKVEVF